MKRKSRDDDRLSGPSTSKKRRSSDASSAETQTQDKLTTLPHELILRILHLLPVRSILLCQQLSKKWQRLAGDAQLWKGLYYRRWVRPRVLMLRRDGGGEAAGETARERLPEFPSRRSKWLDEGRLLGLGGDGEREERTDWRARYRLRHNWSTGAAEVREIGLDRDQPVGGEGDALLVRLVGGLVVTVDARDGLRAWDLKGSKCVARSNAEDRALMGRRIPSCLGVDTASEAKDGSRVVVGFEDGGFWIWGLRLNEGSFEGLYGGGYDKSSAIAYAHPYLLTITDEQVMSLYSLDGTLAPQGNPESQPRLLTSLRSHTSWPPLSLSIRSTPQSIIASIAYALPTYLSGWSVGLQELHLTPSGSVSHSRIASAIEQGFQPLRPSDASPSPTEHARSNYISSHPTSLSYSHPYLLAGNRDNTLTLYLVTSSNSELKISSGTRLWGHTSSVAGAQIGGRGKAVSISARGEELRIWELEAGLGRKMVGDRSVRVRADGKDVSMRHGDVGGEERRPWVGFDDEVVIVLKDEGDGEKALIVYDFT
jgi:F-box-like